MDVVVSVNNDNDDIIVADSPLLVRYDCPECGRNTSQFVSTVVYCDRKAQHRIKKMALMIPVTDRKSG